jgi:hypothetical protein
MPLRSRIDDNACRQKRDASTDNRDLYRSTRRHPRRGLSFEIPSAFRALKPRRWEGSKHRMAEDAIRQDPIPTGAVLAATAVVRHIQRCSVTAASGRLAPARCARPPAPQQRLPPDARIRGAEVLFCTSHSLHIIRSPRSRERSELRYPENEGWPHEPPLPC